MPVNVGGGKCVHVQALIETGVPRHHVASNHQDSPSPTSDMNDFCLASTKKPVRSKDLRAFADALVDSQNSEESDAQGTPIVDSSNRLCGWVRRASAVLRTKRQWSGHLLLVANWLEKDSTTRGSCLLVPGVSVSWSPSESGRGSSQWSGSILFYTIALPTPLSRR